MWARSISVGLAALAICAGCGGGSSFGEAAEEWCHAHYPEPEAAELRCFKIVTNRGRQFLETLEAGEQIEAEVDELKRLGR